MGVFNLVHSENDLLIFLQCNISPIHPQIHYKILGISCKIHTLSALCCAPCQEKGITS